MDVLICGAGVGGLALAGALLADGHRVGVLEAGAGLRTDGAAVTIFSNGAAALAGLGAPLPDPAGGGFGGPIETLSVRAASGAHLWVADLRVLRRRTGFPVTTVPRRRLIAHLASRLPDDAIAFDHRVVSVTLDGDRVSAVDERGGAHNADVLVGADGQRSAVRDAILGGGARDCGWTTWQGLAPVLGDLAAGTDGLLMVGPAGLVGMMPAGEGLLQWWFDVEGPRIDPATRSVTDWLAARFAGYAPPVPALLASIADTDIGRYPHVLHEVPDAWGTGPATLLGDAAHAFPPSQAQGANQALEDAWVLRAALRGHGDVAGRLRRYERLRATRARRVSRMAATEATNRPPHPVARHIVRLVPAALAGTAYASLVRRFSSVLNNET